MIDYQEYFNNLRPRQRIFESIPLQERISYLSYEWAGSSLGKHTYSELNVILFIGYKMIIGYLFNIA